jgi:hypothetical protein
LVEIYQDENSAIPVFDGWKTLLVEKYEIVEFGESKPWTLIVSLAGG